jgi:hypothetical protein
VRVGDRSGRSKGFSRCEGDEEGDKASVPKEGKEMCEGRADGLGDDAEGQLLGPDILVVSDWLLD